MEIELRCPHCGTQYRIPSDAAGRRARCAKCKHTMQIPALPPGPFETYAEEPAAPPAPERPVPPPLPPVQEELNAWAPMPDDDEPVEIATSPRVTPSAPELPRPADHATNRPARLGFGAIADFAFDRMKITYALQWGAIWTLAAVVSGLIGRYVSVLAGPFLFMIATYVCLLSAITGISFLAGRKLETGRTPHWSQAWELLVSRAVSILFGVAAVVLLVLIAETLLFGGISMLSRIDTIGRFLGGILTIPTFVLLLFFLALTCNLYLLPIIIGVESNSAFQSFTILRQLITQNGFALYSRYLQALFTIGPFTLFSGVLVFGTLYSSLSVCGGADQLWDMLTIGMTMSNVLQLTSTIVIIAVYLAFLLVFSTVSFTLVYCECVERVHVDR